jgi:hypothetical protein
VSLHAGMLARASKRTSEGREFLEPGGCLASKRWPVGTAPARSITCNRFVDLIRAAAECLSGDGTQRSDAGHVERALQLLRAGGPPG